jgi:hypothetical protein
MQQANLADIDQNIERTICITRICRGSTLGGIQDKAKLRAKKSYKSTANSTWAGADNGLPQFTRVSTSLSAGITKEYNAGIPCPGGTLTYM